MKPDKTKISRSDLRIETERLLIRPFELKDIEPSYQMELDPEVNRFTGDGETVNKEEIERRIIENVFGDYEKYGFGRLAVEWKADNEFIGFAGLKYLEDMNEVDIGYRFMKKYWNKGIATESGRKMIDLGFTKLGLNKIVGLVLPENSKSIRVLEKLGMEYQKDIIEYDLKVKLYSIKNGRN